jgi:hypothetical protein
MTGWRAQVVQGVAVTKFIGKHVYSHDEKHSQLLELVSALEILLASPELFEHYPESVRNFTECLRLARSLVDRGFTQEQLSELSRTFMPVLWAHPHWNPPLIQSEDGTWREPDWYPRFEKIHERATTAVQQLLVLSELHYSPSAPLRDAPRNEHHAEAQSPQREATNAEFPTLVCSTRRRSKYQFSLMTLLVVVTLFCLCLGGYLSRSPHRKAEEAIWMLGGEVEYHESGEGRSVSASLFRTTATDACMPHLGGLINLDAVVLRDSRVTDAGLAHLVELKGLKYLDLDNTQVTDGGLVHLVDLKGLKFLDLSNTQVTDAGLVHLAGLTKLETLLLSNTRVTDAGLVQLTQLKQLTYVSVSSTKVTDAGLPHLARLTELETLQIDDTRVTDAGLVHLAGLTKLDHLYVSDTQITDVGLVRLEGQKNLKYLYLKGYFKKSRLTDAGIAKLQNALPDCQIVPP